MIIYIWGETYLLSYVALQAQGLMNASCLIRQGYKLLTYAWLLELTMEV